MKNKIKNLIEELDLEKFPIEEQEAIIMKMADVVYDRILLKIINSLTDKETIEIAQLIDKKDREKIDKILELKLPNFNKLVEGEILKFQQEIVKEVKA